MKLEDCIGKICPYCKSKLKETDDIVACSACEMPHHKDCWVENQGCTTFGCMGTISRVSRNDVFVDITLDDEDSSSEPVSVPVVCTRCGNTLSDGMRFCNRCGTPRPAEPAAAQSVYCTGCGNSMSAEAKFCTRCGKTRGTPAAQPAAPAYVPPAPVYTPPVYTPPAPVYAPPAPVYTPPAPVYTPPAPVYTPPAPVYAPPTPVYAPPAPTYAPPAPAYAPPMPQQPAQNSVFCNRCGTRHPAGTKFCNRCGYQLGSPNS